MTLDELQKQEAELAAQRTRAKAEYESQKEVLVGSMDREIEKTETALRKLKRAREAIMCSPTLLALDRVLSDLYSKFVDIRNQIRSEQRRIAELERVRKLQAWSKPVLNIETFKEWVKVSYPDYTPAETTHMSQSGCLLFTASNYGREVFIFTPAGKPLMHQRIHKYSYPKIIAGGPEFEHELFRQLFPDDKYYRNERIISLDVIKERADAYYQALFPLEQEHGPTQEEELS